MHYMQDQLITAGLFAVGALGFFLWGLLDVYAATKKTDDDEVFDLWLAVQTILPGVVAALLTGLAAPQSIEWSWQAIVQVVTVITGGYGFAAVQRRTQKLVIESFFTVKKKS